MQRKRKNRAPAVRVYNLGMDTNPNPHEFTHDAWEVNADVWDARMGHEGNDFFKIWYVPYGFTIG